jgi:hypothetical protein
MPLQEQQILELSSVGSQERTSDSPCHVVLIVWVIFRLVFPEFLGIIPFQSPKKMSHHYARVVGSGIDFLFMLASRMLLPLNLGFFFFSCGVQNRYLACNLCCCCSCSDFQYPGFPK